MIEVLIAGMIVTAIAAAITIYTVRRQTNSVRHAVSASQHTYAVRADLRRQTIEYYQSLAPKERPSRLPDPPRRQPTVVMLDTLRPRLFEQIDRGRLMRRDFPFFWRWRELTREEIMDRYGVQQ